MRFTIAVLALGMTSGSASAQQQSYAGMETRAIKTLSDQQIADLKAGNGMGLAVAAELNGYPGPRHAIDLADQLQLTADQLAKLKALYEVMKAEAIPIGATLIAHERNLNNDFANHTITLASLQAATQQIGETQAALRATHLKYHLATVSILTPEQVNRYGELRGYAGGGTPRHQHQHVQ